MAFRVSGSLILVGLTLAACGREGSRPFASPSPLRAANGVLAITGPPQIAPSSTGRFTAWLRRSGQPDEDVTGRAQWRSTQPHVATVQAGVVSAHAIGEAVIEALLDGQQIGRVVRAVPEGTFALNGTVRPSGAMFRARVEVSGGVGPPASAETSDLGTFRVLGVGGRVRVTVRMDGFASHTAEVDVSADTQHDVVLELDDSARPWRLTVTAARECGTEAGAEFAADVSLLVRAPVVLLSPVDEPTLVFYGRLESDRLTMLLAGLDDGWDYYPPGVRLRSASGAETVALGRMLASSSSSEFTGRLQGYLSGLPVQGAFCYSDLHQITLRERSVSP